MTNLSNLTSLEIEELNALKDFESDYSDIPQTLDFSKAKFKYYNIQPKKQTITLRLDADLVAVLKSYGKGYQTKINEILRKEVMGA